LGKRCFSEQIFQQILRAIWVHIAEKFDTKSTQKSLVFSSKAGYARDLLKNISSTTQRMKILFLEVTANMKISNLLWLN